MSRTLRFALLATALCAVPASAADSGLYVSLKLGSTDLDASLGTAFEQVVDGDDDSMAYELGFRFSKHWAVQAGYHDFGRASGIGRPCGTPNQICSDVAVPVTAESTAYSLSLIPQLPLGKRLSLFGKIGLISWESDIRASTQGVGVAAGIAEEDFIWGVGARFGILGPFELFYEYEGVGDELETQAFGLTFQF